MKFHLKKFLMPAAAICTACLLMGVEDCDPDQPTSVIDDLLQVETEPPKAAISIHEIVKYPRADETEQVVPSYFGAEVTIRRLPLLYYKEILSATPIPRTGEDGFFDIRIKLTGRGRKMWIGLSVPNRSKQLALLIDGMYYRSFRPRLIYDESSDEVIIDGPFDQATAKELEVNTPLNYKKGQRKK